MSTQFKSFIAHRRAHSSSDLKFSLALLFIGWFLNISPVSAADQVKPASELASQLTDTSSRSGQTNTPQSHHSVTVATSHELHAEINKANARGGYTQILLQPGVYTLQDTLYINADHITLQSKSGKPTDTIVQGTGMQADTKVGNLLRVAGNHFTLEGLTLQNSGNHLIQIAGEQNADHSVIRHCIFKDAFQQMIKVSRDESNHTADHGLIEHSKFFYSAGIGPQWYIGGIDAHGAKHWVVRHNQFSDIASPNQHIAEYAVHFWNGSADNTVEYNHIVDCDRGIGFGMQDRPNQGGIIRHNHIQHNNKQDPFADVAIALEDSAHTKVHDNTIELDNGYRWSIEYRFPSSRHNEIFNNIVNRPIRSRDGGQAKVFNNQLR